MLHFLRKYQKVFFAIVAIVIIASFSLFGTYGTIQQEVETPDRRVGTLIDGSALMQKEVDLLTRFLNSSPQERQILEKGQMPNMLNDGVVQQIFMKTGLLPLVAKPYFAEIAAEVQERLDKARQYRHYTHTQVPFISADAVWGRFLPSMKGAMERLAQTTQATPEALELLNTLYLEQQQLPPDVLRQILSYQQQLVDWIPRDPKLDYTDLSLFGFQTLDDWFGPKLMHLLAQTILNGAAEARMKGYHVSEDEARYSLQMICSEAVQKATDQRQFTQQELSNIYQQQFRLLYTTERQMISLWQKVLAFRQMTDHVGEMVVLDEEAYKNFSDFANEKVVVTTYELPNELQLKNFRSLLKLQTYLDSVAVDGPKKGMSALRLPSEMSSVDEVRKRTPELVERRFVAEIAEIDYETLASRVPFKQVYAWEMEEKNWEILAQEYPVLRQQVLTTADERYAYLEQMESSLRQRIDRLAREMIVKEHPEWIEGALAQAERKKVTFGLRDRGGSLPFVGISDRETFEKTLDGIATKTAPYRFSPDGYHHYEIVLVEPPTNASLLSFVEASADGTLDTLLDRKLEESYPEIRKKYSSVFQVSSGGWKPLADVKDHVGAYLYIDLLKSIETIAKEAGVKWPKLEAGTFTQHALDLYAHYRLQPFMQEALGALSRGENEASTPWKLVKQEKLWSRAEAQAYSSQLGEVFEKATPTWSALAAKEPSEWMFIHVLERKKGDPSDVEKMVKLGQERLATEAKCAFLQNLFAQLETKKVIAFTEWEKSRGQTL